MSKLPDVKYSSGIGKTTQIRFGGLRHTVNCTDGEIYDMENLSARYYPVLSSRPKRWISEHGLADATAFYADHGILLYIDGEEGMLYYKQWPIYPVTTSAKTKFIRFGDRVILAPAMLLLSINYEISQIARSTDELVSGAEEGEAWAVGTPGSYRIYVFSEGEWVDAGDLVTMMRTGVRTLELTIADGTIYGAEANGNTVVIHGVEDPKMFFNIGDGVRFDGLTKQPENNKTAIIREIEGSMIRFSDNCFTMPSDEEGNPLEAYSEPGPITITRDVPAADIWFEHDNRLWAAEGKKLYASKLGDPLNFNVFDGLATDSWYLETQKKGEFTGGVSYGGYPTFFREHSILRVYGTEPEAFQTYEFEAPGVRAKQDGSLAIAGGVLFYLSNDGMMAYDGDWPKDLQQVFGWPYEMPELCIACSDGVDMFLYQRFSSSTDKLYRFDALRGIWTIESADDGIASMTLVDGSEVSEGAILALDGDGKVIALKGKPEGLKGPFETMGGFTWEAENAVTSFVEFGDFTDNSPNRKGMTKVQLRLRAQEGAAVTVKLQYDSNGEWETVRAFTAGRKDSYYLPVLPRRCDHYRLRIEAAGEWQLYSMSRELYLGSAKR